MLRCGECDKCHTNCQEKVEAKPRWGFQVRRGNRERVVVTVGHMPTVEKDEDEQTMLREERKTDKEKTQEQKYINSQGREPRAQQTGTKG